jgi:DNA-binding transcriptional ArsR family regulator
MIHGLRAHIPEFRDQAAVFTFRKKTGLVSLTSHELMIYLVIMTSAAAQSLIPMERLEAAATVMRVLSHPHRLRICELLMAGRHSVNALAECLGIPGNAVSQHLNMMKAHGLLSSHREGKTVYYRVVDPRPEWLLACIRDHSPEEGRG